MIVTSNLKDFPADLLEELGLHAASPDEFLLDLYDLNSDIVSKALNNQSLKTQNLSITRQEILQRLSGLAPNFVKLTF